MTVQAAFTAIVGVAFFTSFSLFFTSIRDNETIYKNRFLLISSFGLFVAYFLLYFDNVVSTVTIGKFILSFFTFSILGASIMSIGLLVSSLYIDLDLRMLKIFIPYSIICGFVFVIDTQWGNASTRQFAIFLAMSPGYLVMIYTLIKSKVKLFKNGFVYQIFIIAFLYLGKSINVYQHRTDMLNERMLEIDLTYTMLILIFIDIFFVTYLIERNTLMNDELKKSHNQMSESYKNVKELSETDMLTQLFNRRKMFEILEYVCKYEGNGNTGSLVMLDIDGFKHINDTYGHKTGDEVLQFVARSLETVLRKDDLVARWGGDEFLVLLRNQTENSVKGIIQKIHKHFKAHPFGKQNIQIRVSCGYSLCNGDKNYNEAINRADKMMYKNKNLQAKQEEKYG